MLSTLNEQFDSADLLLRLKPRKPHVAFDRVCISYACYRVTAREWGKMGLGRRVSLCLILHFVQYGQLRYIMAITQLLLTRVELSNDTWRTSFDYVSAVSNADVQAEPCPESFSRRI